jgi:carboxyl-terminal processing protease
MKKFGSGILLFLTIITSALSSCRKDKSEKFDSSLSANNRWVLDSMKVYYYWNQELPKEPGANESSNAFFKSLLYPADRFSYMESPSEIKTEYSSFAWYGFEYALIQSNNFPGFLAGTVTLVVPDGPADKKGLKRGDLFTAVNGIIISAATSNSIKAVLAKGDGIQLQLADCDNKELKPGSVININHFNFTERPVYTTQVFPGAAAKTGYIYYNWFNGPHDYDILDTLSKLRNQGISELILDLRYNPGGDVSSVAKIAGTLTPTTSGQTFAIYQANKNGGRINKSFDDLIKENGFQPQNFSELVSRRILLKRVIILTSGSTASAAELLINNLKPFMQVIQIGSATTGKDMASFAISDLRNPKLVDLTLHPLIFKLYNAKGQGDYSNGLPPDFLVDEFSVIPLKPFGDPNDPLLKKALEITGMQKIASAGGKREQNATYSFAADPIFINKRTLPIDIKKDSW